MKEVMWHADPELGQVFSDRTDPNQMVLIEPATNLAPLGDILRRKFRGHGWVEIEAVERFVLVDTPYSEVIHLKQRTLGRIEREEPVSIEVRRPPGKRNRPGEYPKGTKLNFL